MKKNTNKPTWERSRDKRAKKTAETLYFNGRPYWLERTGVRLDGWYRER